MQSDASRQTAAPAEHQDNMQLRTAVPSNTRALHEDSVDNAPLPADRRAYERLSRGRAFAQKDLEPSSLGIQGQAQPSRFRPYSRPQDIVVGRYPPDEMHDWQPASPSPGRSRASPSHRRRRHGTVSPRVNIAMRLPQERCSPLVRAMLSLALRHRSRGGFGPLSPYGSPWVTLSPASPPPRARSHPSSQGLHQLDGLGKEKKRLLEVRFPDSSINSPANQSPTSLSPRRRSPSHRTASPKRSCMANSSKAPKSARLGTRRVVVSEPSSPMLPETQIRRVSTGTVEI